MGTRSITVVVNQGQAIALYKHWDGYPEEMIKNFKNARCFMGNYEEGYLPHFLTYPEDVSAAIIVSFWLDVNKGKTNNIWPPDFRPVSGFNVNDSKELIKTAVKLAEEYGVVYIYIIDIQEGQHLWRVKIYERDNEGYKYVGKTDITCN